MAESDAYWAITLSGDQFDLLEWSSALPKPFDPWVDTLRVEGADRHILGSAEFVRMNSPAEVQERAFVMLEALNGAMRAFQGTDSVKFDDVIRVQADGTARRHLLMSAKATIRSRLYIKDNGPIVQTNVQKAFALAVTNDFVADMLAHSAKGDTWYELYKMYECVRELSGGHASLKEKAWAPSGKILNDFTHSANYYRHSRADPASAKPPTMTLEEASALIKTMIQAILRELSL